MNANKNAIETHLYKSMFYACAIHVKKRRRGLVVIALDFGAEGPGTPGWCYTDKLSVYPVVSDYTLLERIGVGKVRRRAEMSLWLTPLNSMCRVQDTAVHF